MTMDLILFHAACPDGFAAAWVGKRKYPSAELMPLDHGLAQQQLDNVFAKAHNKNILMLDYSLRTRDLNDSLNDQAKSLLILDHHRTAQDALKGASYAIFDMERSGAGLAWDYLFGKDSGRWCGPTGEGLLNDKGYFDRPWFIDYVEARDLWRWDSVPNAKEICAYIGSLPFTIEAYDKLLYVTTDYAQLLGTGALDHINHFVRETIKNVRYGTLLGHQVAILNATYLNCSEIGNELAKNPEVDFSVTWFERKDDTIQFSLRSIGDFDVSTIAKQFKGGGHRNASGFQLSIEGSRRLIDDILGR